MIATMRRREFITLVGGAAAGAWPVAARGQQQRRTANIGVFSYSRENDPQANGYLEAFLKRLAEFGWSQGANLRIEYRWTGGNAALIRQYATELSAAALDVVLVAGGSHVGLLQQVTHTLPIVFVEVADAVGSGFVESLARPGGMPLASPTSNSISAGNGSNCLSRLRRMWRAPRFFAIRETRPEPPNSA
jgi:putative ABC transport system substrate-binding protein